MATPAPPRGEIAPPARTFRVAGTIVDAGGSPVPGLIVTAYDRDLRSAELLGNSVFSDARGRYEIFYGPGDFHRTEQATADVFIEVRDGRDGRPERSAVVYNAHRDLTIDLRLPQTFFDEAE